MAEAKTTTTATAADGVDAFLQDQGLGDLLSTAPSASASAAAAAPSTTSDAEERDEWDRPSDTGRSRSPYVDREQRRDAHRDLSPHRTAASVTSVGTAADVFDFNSYRRSRYTSETTAPSTRSQMVRATSRGGGTRSVGGGGGGGGGSSRDSADRGGARRAAVDFSALVADMPDDKRNPPPVEFKTDDPVMARQFFRLLAGALGKEEHEVWVDHDESNRLRKARQKAQQIRAAALMAPADFLNQIALQEALQTEESELEPTGIYVTPLYYTALMDTYDDLRTFTDTIRPIEFFMRDDAFKTKFAQYVSTMVGRTQSVHPNQWYAKNYAAGRAQEIERMRLFFKKKLAALEESGSAIGSLTEFNYTMLEHPTFTSRDPARQYAPMPPTLDEVLQFRQYRPSYL